MKVSVVILFALFSWVAFAEDPPKVQWGGFIDSYYAYDFADPPHHDRSYTTQAARNNEFNVNLAFIDAKVSEDAFRARLAFQAGTSVQANYAAEPTQGQISGPLLSRTIQEAVAGFRVTPDWWIDVGIYSSHVGLETWISADNWTYTRSLVADFSPYYQSGIRSTWKLSDSWSAQLHVINGWQNISENNGAKSIGTQLSFTPDETWSASYNTILGMEAGFRQYHDLVLKFAPPAAYQVAAEVDFGRQSHAPNDPANWWGVALIQRVKASERLWLPFRIERFSDPDAVLAPTPLGAGLQAWGASLGIDYQLRPQVLIRNELRRLWAREPSFPGKTGLGSSDTVWTSSIGLRI